MLSIGYGQYPPRNMTDTWLTIGSMLAGASCYALFIGHATTLIQSFDTSSRQFRDHVSHWWAPTDTVACNNHWQSCLDYAIQGVLSGVIVQAKRIGDDSKLLFYFQLQQVNEYMIYRKLPMDLRRRITDYYDHRFGGKMFDEAAILSEISDSLRKVSEPAHLLYTIWMHLPEDNSW